MSVQKNDILVSAERNLLSALTQNPKHVFDIDKILIKESDFSNDLTKCIYIAIKDIANAQKGAPQKIDDVIIEERFRAIFPAIYNNRTKDISEAIHAITSNAQITNVDDLVRIIVTASIRRQSQQLLHTILTDVDDMHDGIEMLQHIENKVFNFTNNVGQCNDIESLCADFDKWIIQRVQEAKAGKLHIGIPTGFPLYDKVIGGGLRPKTINLIAARAKMGKSFFVLTLAYNIVKSGIPVLYLDTELDKDYQRIRLSGMVAQIPLHDIETCTFIQNKEYVQRMKKIMHEITQFPLDYVTIKGWSIQEQISIIRRWFAKRVGKNADGEYNKAVVILDYLKIMNPGDKGYNIKEYEALGYHMTSLHDLMSQYNAPMIMLAQQNRSGLDREDETTISGSDRLIWFCDNFSILANKSAVELDAIEVTRDQLPENMPTIQQPDSSIDFELPNMKLIVKDARHGPGTQKGYIGLYCDLKDPRRQDDACGIIKEKKMELS